MSASTLWCNESSVRSALSKKPEVSHFVTLSPTSPTAYFRTKETNQEIALEVARITILLLAALMIAANAVFKVYGKVGVGFVAHVEELLTKQQALWSH